MGYRKYKKLLYYVKLCYDYPMSNKKVKNFIISIKTGFMLCNKEKYIIKS